MTEIAHDAAIFRYTVRAPAARERAIRDAARRAGVEPGHLVQMLFDRLNVTALDHVSDGMARSVRGFVQAFREIDVHGREHRVAAAAADAGMPMKTLRVLAALADAAGGGLVCRSSEAEIGARARIADCSIDGHFDVLMAAGWIAPVHGCGRARRTVAILRVPSIATERTSP
ncbi:MAG: hypothetical protein ACK4U0_17300 [Mesorhizobium sp.]